MKKILCSLLILSSAGITLAQKSKNPSPPDVLAQATIDKRLVESYQMSLSYGDYESAKNAVYLILGQDQENLAWRDTLLQLYFSMGAYAQCILVGNEYLLKNDTNYSVLELVAASEYSLKRYKEALTAYEKLFGRSKSSQHAYQLAINQYMMQRLGECDQSLQFILADFASEKQNIVMSMNQDRSQEVPLRAAAWNMRGVMMKDLNKMAEAKTCFEQALKLAPEFALAKTNIASLTPPAPVPSPEAGPKPSAKPAAKPAPQK